MLCGCQQQGMRVFGFVYSQAKQATFQQGSVIRKLPGNFSILFLRNLMLERGYCSPFQQPATFYLTFLFLCILQDQNWFKSSSWYLLGWNAKQGFPVYSHAEEIKDYFTKPNGNQY